MDRSEIIERVRQVEPWQWAIAAAIVAVVAAVFALTAPSFLPKPRPVPQEVPQTPTQTPQVSAVPSAVPTETRDAVLAAVERDGIVVTNPDSVKVNYASDKTHVRVYGQFGGKFRTYRYVQKDGAWQRQ
ncbi:MAG TPA: hypothetical protein VGK50_06465 [Coriobacteriia bacterium]|jgi:hypothetical protein